MISIANGLTVGRYEIEYKISSRVNPTSVDAATIIINIVDTTEPDIPLLNDVVKYCEASVTAPSTTDNCSGLITATTHDALNYYEVGSYILHWTFTDESGNQTTAQQNVTVKSAEETEPSYGYINCNLDNDFSLNIDLNSYLPEDIDADGAWSSVLPTPNLNGSVFSPYQAPTGNYEFEYIREKSNCYQTLKVVITVNDDCFVAPACNLLVHNAFSPNNDGVNDFFFIENIDQTFCFPTNSVEIYNRWGVLVYKTKQYDNVTSVFRGISEGRLTINESEQLPTGTYYYMINYTDDKGNIHDKVGYVYLSL
jgi:gliding motility-associated-like protein